jgi:hypothetical protein
MASKPHARCECYDLGDAHPMAKDTRCTNRERLKTLFRVDMFDITGTKMCEHCATDALTSSWFTLERPTRRMFWS